MANRNMDQSWCLGKRLIDLAGNFVPLTGAGIVLASAVRGFGFGYAPTNGVMTLQPRLTSSPLTSTPGILRTGTGVYTITLEDAYLSVNDYGCDLAVPAGGSQLWVQPVEPVANLASSTLAPTFTMTIVNNAGTPTDAAASSRVYFWIELRDSNVQFAKP